MRKLSEDFKNKFANDFKFVIDFVKDNKEDVFLGIRNDSINLYANGGSFFQIKKTKNAYIASLNEGEEKAKKGYYNNISKEDHQILKLVNEKPLTKESITIWKDLLPRLKDDIKAYMLKHKRGKGEGASKEKILQEKLALAFNNSNTPYYNYDLEYNIENLNDYYFKKDGTPDLNRTHTLGRVDNMVISINNNKLKLLLFELKEGLSAIENTNYNSKSKDKKYDSFGNGVIGHVNLYMSIIDKIKRNNPYVSLYRTNIKNAKDTFNIRQDIMTEIKETMKFYQEYDLINNDNFKKIDYDKIEYEDVELVFYLGGYSKNSKKLETHLGLCGNNNDSVLNLINNNPTNLKYISKEEIYDFKYYKDFKLYTDPLTKEDLEVENYTKVIVVKDKDKVEFQIK